MGHCVCFSDFIFRVCVCLFVCLLVVRSYDTVSHCENNEFDDEPYIVNIRPTNVCLPLGIQGNPRVVLCTGE